MKGNRYIQIAVVAAILIAINVVVQYFRLSVDMTEDNRYTLTEPTRTMLSELDDVIYIEVLLAGKFPAGFKRLQNSVTDMLQQMNDLSGGYIDWEYKDPTEGDVETVNLRKQELAEKNILPMTLKIPDGDQLTQRLIYPFAIVHYGNRAYSVDLLEPDVPGMDKEVILNNSVSLLEYKFASAIQKIRKNRKPIVLLTEGHGELGPRNTADFEVELRRFYDTGRINLDSITAIDDRADVLIIAKPLKAFSDRSKFLIDQFIMNGGRAMFLIDKLLPRLDSVGPRMEYIPPTVDPNLDDLLFKYGVRINNDLVLDMECSSIPIIVDQQGGKAVVDPKKWPFYPVALGPVQHPLTSSLDRVDIKWASSMDTIQTATPVKKTAILSTSEYSRVQLYPMRLGFEILRYASEPDRYNQPHIPLGMLLEGRFTSLYKNRVSAGMDAMLNSIGQSFKGESSDTKILVFSDGDIMDNGLNRRTGMPDRLGYNDFERYTFANKPLLLNAIDYLVDDGNIITSRSKNVKLRLLDTVKAERESGFYRLLNIGGPLLLLAMVGFLFNYLRKRRYTS